MAKITTGLNSRSGYDDSADVQHTGTESYDTPGDGLVNFHSAQDTAIVREFSDLSDREKATNHLTRTTPRLAPRRSK
jgi:hypothetical protein